MRAAALRESIYIERRGKQGDDGYGNVVEGWARFTPTGDGTLPAKIVPKRGSEELIAARATGVAIYEITVRYSTLTQGITEGDRVVNARTGQTYNIKWPDNLDMRKRYMVMLCEAGGPDG